MREVNIRLQNPGSIQEPELNYVVMAARYQDQWIFVRHRERSSWEMVSGHIEEGELPDQAALRELNEEAGVIKSSMEVLCDYEVEVEGKREYGRFYGVVVSELDPVLKHETEELVLTGRLPESLTYPEVHTSLFQRALEHFGLS
jgi:8-oxo-dGTP diphosphatase